MSENTNANEVAAPAETAPVVELTDEQKAAAAKITEQLNAIDREYFGPAELDKAQARLSEVVTIAAAAAIQPVRNFDPEKEFPEGYGLSIMPINKRGDDGNVVTGLSIAAIPDPEKIASSEGGADYIRKTILDACLAKLANAVRPRGDDNSVAASIPFSVQDFITTSRGGESMATFRKLAPAYVAALKKKGIRFMSAILLRQLFQSASFAESQFPGIPQEQWTKIMDGMISKATAEKLDVTVLQNWKESRNQAEVGTGDVDLSDLGDLA